MGYHIHHTMVLTSWNEQHIDEAHQLAMGIFGSLTSNLSPQQLNGYKSFFIAPDGSKEGWPDSDKADAHREEFKKALRAKNLFVEWIELSFGGDEPEENTCIIEQGYYEEPVDEHDAGAGNE